LLAATLATAHAGRDLDDVVDACNHEPPGAGG